MLVFSFFAFEVIRITVITVIIEVSCQAGGGTAGMRCFQVGALAIVSTICHLDKVRPLKYTIVSYRLTEALKYTIQQFK